LDFFLGGILLEFRIFISSNIKYKTLNNLKFNKIVMGKAKENLWTIGLGFFCAGLGFYGLSTWEGVEKVLAIALIAFGIYLISLK